MYIAKPNICRKLLCFFFRSAHALETYEWPMHRVANTRGVLFLSVLTTTKRINNLGGVLLFISINVQLVRRVSLIL